MFRNVEQKVNNKKNHVECLADFLNRICLLFPVRGTEYKSKSNLNQLE